MNVIKNPIKDIERWIPDRWDQVIGNQALKEYFWDLIWCVRQEGHPRLSGL